MKILIPILGFGRAGGYRVLSKLADELILLDHCVEFLCPDENGEPYFPTHATIKWIDENGAITANKQKSGKKENAFSIQQKLTKALSTISKDFYDIIIANHSLTTLPIKRAGLIHKTLYYVQAYEPDFYNLLGGLKNRILAHLSERSYKMNLFTVVNSEIYLKYKKLNSSRILYPGVDFKLFYPKIKELNYRVQDKIIIGTVGRVERYKGTRYIIEAFNQLKKKYSTIQLHVAFGDPGDFTNYQDICCFQPHGDEELGNFYRTLDYYICAGYTQLGAFHYPVVEAMSCGIPVITTKYYPANEFNAWEIAPQNANEIVIQFELAESDLQLRQKKVEKALVDVQQFEWKLVAKQLNSYINEFVDNSNKN